MQNGQLQLNPLVSIGSSTNNLNLIIEVVDGKGNAFRSDNLNVLVSGGTITVGGGGSSTITYTEGAAPIQLAGGLTLVGGAGAPTQIGGASVSIGDNYTAGQDFLSIGGVPETSGTVGGLQWTFEVTTGVLTLTGDASVAAYQDALRQVTYVNSSQDPNVVGRTIAFRVGDAAAPLGQANLVVDVVAVDNPGFFQVPTAPSIIAGVAGAAVGQIRVDDPDTTYTFSVGGGFDTQFEIVGGQLRLIAGQSITTPGVYQIPLIATKVGAIDANADGIDDVTGGPIRLEQIISLTVQPATTGAFTVGGLPGDGGSATTAYTEQQTPPVVIASGVTISGGGVTLDGASVSITNFDPTQLESLGITGQAVGATSGTIAGTGISWSYDGTTGVLSFFGVGSTVEYEAALQQVVYSNNSDDPLLTRSVNYTVGTGANAGQGIATIGITPVNDAPTAILLSSTNVTLGAAGAIVGDLSVIDPDNTSGFTFSLSDPRFVVVDGPNGLQLRLAPGQTLTSPLNLSVTVTDTGNPPGSFTQSFAITPSSSSLTAIPQSDLLFAEPVSGALQVWTLNNISEVAAANAVQTVAGQALTIPAGWSIIDTADFDGNGIADILWQGTDGANKVVGIWYMNAEGRLLNTAVVKADGVNNGLLGGFDVVGAADMNRDGNIDVVLRAPEADLTQVWLLDGTTAPSILGGAAGIVTLIDPRDGQPFRATNSNWSIDALGDFNGDGNIDLVYRWAEQSATTIVSMNGTQVIGFTGMPAIGPTFEIRAVGDFNGDGIQDLLWRDNRFNQGASTVDQTILWTMGRDTTTGAFTATPSVVETAVPLIPGWQIFGAGDFNADSTHDIFFRNVVTDENAVWLMQNGEVLATRFITDERPGSPQAGQFARINQPGQNWDVSSVDEFGGLAAAAV
ncbi:MAG: VCBS repeat-containing protein [Alkalinema sp. RL_2_19]|nr:VCBS repeat-containing protein [Alkalinema sp. RL_2_19]